MLKGDELYHIEFGHDQNLLEAAAAAGTLIAGSAVTGGTPLQAIQPGKYRIHRMAESCPSA
jgi:hypothetical protein